MQQKKCYVVYISLSVLFFGVGLYSFSPSPLLPTDMQRIIRKPTLIKAVIEISLTGPKKAEAGDQIEARVNLTNKSSVPLKEFDVTLLLRPQRTGIQRIPIKSVQIRNNGILAKRHVRTLRARASKSLRITGQIPENMLPGGYNLGAMVQTKEVSFEKPPVSWKIIDIIKSIPIIQSVHQEQYGFPMAELDITGKNFGSSQGNRTLYLGNHQLSDIREWKDDYIFVVASAHYEYGRFYKISIKSAGNVISNQFDFLLRMWIEIVEPQGAISPGQTITISGFNFDPSQGTKILKLGTVPFTNIISWSDHQIQAVVPNAPAGTHSLSIEKNGIEASRSLPVTVTN